MDIETDDEIRDEIKTKLRMKSTRKPIKFRQNQNLGTKKRRLFRPKNPIRQKYDCFFNK